MAATNDATALRLWTFATFRAATFVVSCVLYLHLTGRLFGILHLLNTALGFAGFSLLWATTLVATRAELRQIPDGESSVGSIVISTTVAGAWNGLYAWTAILLALLVTNVMFGRAAGALILAVVGG